MEITSGKLDKYIPIKKVNNKYVVSWGLNQIDQSNDLWQWYYFVVNHKPSINEIKTNIETFINEQTKNIIFNHFKWNDMKIYLSLENQIDYKLLFDATMIQDGKNLPEVLKFKINDENVYYEITSIDEFKDFILSINEHIRKSLKYGNDLKDSIEYYDYKI